jgi:hypothetical protein
VKIKTGRIDPAIGLELFLLDWNVRHLDRSLILI